MLKGLGNIGDMAKMMKAAQEMQGKMAEMQENLGAVIVTGESGAGLVKATATAKGELTGLEIDPSIFVPTEKEVVEDLILAAIKDAQAKATERAQQEMGVPAEIIVAIIGVETYYGRIAGSYRVIDALSTLAFDYPRRSEFFTKELKNYLILTRDQKMDPLLLKGSYAGAMGYGQFMPSSYRSYAIDFDGDDLADIWNNPVDAIGSVANYFKAHGWTEGGQVVLPARAESAVPDEMLSVGRALKPRFTVGEFIAAGLVPEGGADHSAEAIGVQFELEDGFEYWLGLHNFYVITRYNHSAMYAMSVYQLSQRIAAGMAQ